MNEERCHKCGAYTEGTCPFEEEMNDDTVPCCRTCREECVGDI